MPRGVANRPHIKTHKSPVLAKMQAAAGAKGITCQKLGEAEVMVEGGLDDILISYNLLGAEKMGRLGRLLQRATITVAADNPTTIEGLPQAAEIAGRPLERGDRMRHRPQARGRRDGERGGRAGEAHQGEPRPALRGLPVLSHRAVVAADAALLRRGPEGRPRAGARARAWSPPAARRTCPTWASSRAPPSTAPAPTSSTTA